MWTKRITLPSVSQSQRGRNRRSIHPISLLAPSSTARKNFGGNFTASNRRGSQGGKPSAKHPANTKIANPKGVDNPGIMTGAQKGRARMMINNADARAPSASMISCNVTAWS
jgi:hypothetical protein